MENLFGTFFSINKLLDKYVSQSNCFDCLSVNTQEGNYYNFMAIAICNLSAAIPRKNVQIASNSECGSKRKFDKEKG